MVSTLDFESSDPGSNPGRSYILCISVKREAMTVVVVWCMNFGAYCYEGDGR